MNNATALNLIAPDSPFVHAIMAAEVQRQGMLLGSPRPANGADKHAFDPKQLAALTNAAFWASIAVEEGRPVRGALGFVGPEEAPLALAFRTPAPTNLESIVALMTAAHDSALAVHPGPHGELSIWGIADMLPMNTLRLRIVRPGTVVASLGTDMIALLHQGRVLLPKSANHWQWINVVAHAFAAGMPYPERGVKARRLLRIVASMLAHGHGGTLVIVPAATQLWRSHLSIRFTFSEKHGTNLLRERLAEFETVSQEAENLRRDLLQNRSPEVPQNLIVLKLEAARSRARLVSETLQRLGALTALDGALLLDEDLSVLGFGAKLHAPPEDFCMNLVDVLDGSQENDVRLELIGGTRHQSAARFVHHINDALAFVASQDGRLTLLSWAADQERVVGLVGLEHLIWEFDTRSA